MINFLFLGESFITLAKSLKRFFFYSLNIELRFVDEYVFFESNNNIFIYVINDPIELQNCFSWIHKNNFSPYNLRILGFDSNSDLNLIEVETLKTQIENSFLMTRGIDRSNIPFIRDKVKLFFKGHGEQSLLGCIGWVNYYFGNYRAMAETRQYSPKELNEAFLIPGFQNWHEFMRRFSKYAPILYALGWDKQVVAIERFIKVIVLDINHVELSDALHTFDSETMNSLAGIITAIEEMAIQADHKYNETNLTDH